ncbi:MULTISPECIES: PAS domain S-box protein [Methanocalculus]|uniref:PAS domain S-box protein n=1 Tax=Methanocalculus TaxID=71151 RepID=UPI0020A05437|nr:MULTISPECIES: PAS domain S-box protein [unclassified Methanocalculus]MCP1662497.1 PAS domain S-box-containing protein [Methanocalculus sp. AMF5]
MNTPLLSMIGDAREDGILISDKDSIIYANDTIRRLAGEERGDYPNPDQMIRSILRQSGIDDQAEIAEILGPLPGMIPLRGKELLLQSPSGEKQWYELSIQKREDGKTLWFFRQITRWKTALAKQRESEEKYRLLFHGGYDGIVVYTISSTGEPKAFIEVNDIACRRLGYSRDELRSRSPLDIVPPRRVGGILREVKKLLVSDQILFETEQVRSDGTLCPVEINAHRMMLGDRMVIVSISRDITRRRRDFEIKQTAYRQIEENIEQFAILGDHIRNPLTVILGYAGCCGDEAIGEEIRMQVEIIRGYLDQLDQGWIESEKVRSFLRRHYR